MLEIFIAIVFLLASLLTGIGALAVIYLITFFIKNRIVRVVVIAVLIYILFIYFITFLSYLQSLP
mgnify:FL=1